MKPGIVSNKNLVDYKVFVLIVSLVIVFQLFIITTPDEELKGLTISIVWIATPSIASIASFLVYKRYRGSIVFGKAYFALGMGFLMLACAETTYIIYDFVLYEDPYPSIADVFYFAFYIPFALYHLRTNINFFNPNYAWKTKVWMAAIGGSIIIAYLILAYDVLGEFNFDYLYGLLFVIAVGITLPYTILGAISFKGGTMGVAWLILVLGILLFAVGDTTYYYLELFGGYTTTHFINLFWIGGYMVIVYALYKHTRAV